MSSPLSGFTAVPNPQMLAFMPIQSYLMMYFAGAGWQIGKRKISAIPNPEFNKMSAKDLLEGFTADLRSTIPTLERSLQDITPLIETLIAQYGEFVTVALREIPQAAQVVVESQLTKEGTISKWLLDLIQNAGKIPTAEAFSGGHRTFGADESAPDLEPTLSSEGHAERVAEQAIENARVKRLQMELEARARAQERLTQRKVIPAAHIKSRPASNVSMQSLKLEKANLQFQIRRAITNRQKAIKSFAATNSWPARIKKSKSHLIRQKQSAVATASSTLQVWRQKLANFNAMHGARF